MSSRKIFKEEQRIEGRSRAQETRKVAIYKCRETDKTFKYAGLNIFWMFFFFSSVSFVQYYRNVTKSKPWYVAYQWKGLIEASPWTSQAHHIPRRSYSREKLGLVELCYILTLTLTLILSLSPSPNP